MVKGNIKFIYGHETGIILGVNKSKNIKELYLERVKIHFDILNVS